MREKYNNNYRRTGNYSESGGKQPPPAETHAETYYYKKQMDARTNMVFVLQDGEKIEGVIDWYDVDALKISRENAPKILLLKHNIKYLYKAETDEE